MEDKVIEIIAMMAGVDKSEITESTPLRSGNKNEPLGLGLDFEDCAIILGRIEKEFNITLSDNVIEDTYTVGDVIEKLKGKVY